MKPAASLFVLALLLPAAVPALAQTDAGTPPNTSGTAASLPSSLKVTPPSQPGTLTTSKSSYKPGQPVHIVFRVVNTSGKPLTYNFGTGQRFDIVVMDPAGPVVWDWAQGRLFTQDLASVSVAPGKALVYQAIWNGRDPSGHPVRPGTYTLSAHLTSNNQPAITGGVLVNTDPDPTNMGQPTRTPAESGAIRQVDPAAQVSAKTTVVIK